MNNGFKSFIVMCGVVLIILILAFLTLGIALTHFTINIYNVFIIILLIIISGIIVLFLISYILAYKIYTNRAINKSLANLLKIVFRIVFPIIIEFSVFLKNYKDDLKKFYIELNNNLVESLDLRYLPSDVLMIFPHCLQNSKCVYKITNEIRNCKDCGRCKIGKILSLGDKYKISTLIVTGGTAARSAILKHRPRIVISVACERDLYSGIMDVTNIPVIGVLNKRPNGPCLNTDIDVNDIENKIQKIIKLKGD